MTQSGKGNGSTKTKEKDTNSVGSKTAAKSKENHRSHTKARVSVDLGLDDDAVQGVVEILTKALADIEVLYVKTLNVHWNIVDPAFYGIHVLLEEQYNALKTDGDEVAERIRAYGMPVIGSMAEFLYHTRLEEMTDVETVSDGALAELVADHEAVVRQLRKDIERCDQEFSDQGAMDLLIAHMQKHQDMAWMLRAFLRS